MVAAPEGTVTLLFTDIEGSTRLLRETGDGYAVLLLTHRRLLREAFAAHDGYEVDTGGDAFFVAFASAGQAVAAAAQAQHALATYEWPEGQRVWVRIGIHTGEPRLLEGNYIGLDVHHAARVMAAGHGGQVLVSQSTRDLLNEQISLRDLGEHRLKDLSQPQRLHQLQIEGLPGEFPALKTLENRPTNLPVQATALIGRERELGEVAELLLRDEVRLLTLTGPGGTGKTRLALQAAANVVDEFADGVYFVSLSAITDEAFLIPTVAQTLGLREQPGQLIEQTLHDYLGDKKLLLVLDNLEQLLGAAPEIAATLAAAPCVYVLATSRAPLRVAAEHLYPVPTLTIVEGDVEAVIASEAVQLFASRARAVQPQFALDADNAPVVAEICVRLDGLPLAIELAAARTRLLSPEAMLARLDQRLRLLTGGNQDHDERQQTLRATIEWSYDLLAPAEQTVFARLGIFAGGCRLEAAQAVCDPDGDLELDVLEGVSALIDHSLLKRRDDPDGEPRFWMLESIREYALSQGGDGNQREVAEGAMIACLQNLVDASTPHFHGDERQTWLVRLDAETANFREALGRNFAPDDSRQLQLASGLAHYWYQRGRLREGRQILESALQRCADPPYELLKDALWGACLLAHRTGDYNHPHASRRLQLCRDQDDHPGIAESLLGVALADQATGDWASAGSALEECVSLSREGGFNTTLAMALGNLGDLHMVQGDYQAATRNFEDSLEMFRELGDERHAAATVANLGSLAVRAGRHDDAKHLLTEAISYSRDHPDPEITIWCLVTFAALAADRDELPTAARLLGAVDAAREQTGYAAQLDEQQLETRTRQRLNDNAKQAELTQHSHEGRGILLSEAVDLAIAKHEPAHPELLAQSPHRRTTRL